MCLLGLLGYERYRQLRPWVSSQQKEAVAAHKGWELYQAGVIIAGRSRGRRSGVRPLHDLVRPFDTNTATTIQHISWLQIPWKEKALTKSPKDNFLKFGLSVQLFLCQSQPLMSLDVCRSCCSETCHLSDCPRVAACRMLTDTSGLKSDCDRMIVRTIDIYVPSQHLLHGLGGETYLINRDAIHGIVDGKCLKLSPIVDL